MTSTLKADIVEASTTNGNVTLRGNGTGTVAIGDNTAITGTATVSSTLAVTGATTLTGAATVGSTLGVTGASTLTGGATVSGLQLPNQATLYTGRNMLINSTGWINQRHGIDVANTSINTYAMDRWRTYGGALGLDLRSIGESMTVANTSYNGYFIRFKRTDSQTNSTGIAQGVETLESLRAAGKNVVLSFKARKGANFSQASSELTAGIWAGEGTNNNPVGMTNSTSSNSTHTLTTAWQTFTATAAIESDKTQLTVTFYYTPVGTVGANDYFDVTDIQLELGSVATPPEQPSYHQELERCKRYYTSQGAGVIGYWNGGTNMEVPFQFFPPMRATPTVTIGNSAPSISNKSNSSTGTQSSVAVVNSSGTANGFYFVQINNCDTSTSPSAGNIGQFRTDNFMNFSAEL